VYGPSRCPLLPFAWLWPAVTTPRHHPSPSDAPTLPLFTAVALGADVTTVPSRPLPSPHQPTDAECNISICAIIVGIVSFVPASLIIDTFIDASERILAYLRAVLIAPKQMHRPSHFRPKWRQPIESLALMVNVLALLAVSLIWTSFMFIFKNRMKFLNGLVMTLLKGKSILTWVLLQNYMVLLKIIYD